jgi:NADH:ubiquinone oxidoreductase subunit K
MYTVLTRRNAIGVLMGIELILNAAGINFVAFSRFIDPTQAVNLLSGQVFTLFIIAIAAAEVAVALAIVLALYSRMKSIDVEDFKELQG